MKEKELEEGPLEQAEAEPQVYAVNKDANGAWKFSRRDFLALAGGAVAALVAGATPGCTGRQAPASTPTSAPPPTSTSTPTNTPTQTPVKTPTPSPTPLEKATPTLTPTPQTPSAAFVADVTIPDGTVMMPGQSFTKTWRLVNNGEVNWGEGTQLVFSSGTQMGGESPVPVPDTAPGQTVDISVDMVAPTTVGDYTGNWTLVAGDGTRMITIYVKIAVRLPGQPGEVPAGETGINMTGPGGEVRHLPCGSPIPPGWTCVCNCVTVPAPCSCDTVCTCVGYTTCTCDTIHYWYPN